jgi:hypothetical protein
MAAATIPVLAATEAHLDRKLSINPTTIGQMPLLLVVMAGPARLLARLLVRGLGRMGSTYLVAAILV